MVIDVVCLCFPILCILLIPSPCGQLEGKVRLLSTVRKGCFRNVSSWDLPGDVTPWHVKYGLKEMPLKFIYKYAKWLNVCGSYVCVNVWKYACYVHESVQICPLCVCVCVLRVWSYVSWVVCLFLCVILCLFYVCICIVLNCAFLVYVRVSVLCVWQFCFFFFIYTHKVKEKMCHYLWRIQPQIK